MNESIKDLAKYRLDKALEELKNSEAMIKSKSYSKSLNCSYYAIFHVTRALLAFDKFDSRKHSGIISYFIKKYINSNIIDNEFSKIIVKAQNYRIKSDYLDFFVVSKAKQLNNMKMRKGLPKNYPN